MPVYGSLCAGSRERRQRDRRRHLPVGACLQQGNDPKSGYGVNSDRRWYTSLQDRLHQANKDSPVYWLERRIPYFPIWKYRWR